MPATYLLALVALIALAMASKVIEFVEMARPILDVI